MVIEIEVRFVFGKCPQFEAVSGFLGGRSFMFPHEVLGQIPDSTVTTEDERILKRFFKQKSTSPKMRQYVFVVSSGRKAHFADGEWYFDRLKPDERLGERTLVVRRKA